MDLSSCFSRDSLDDDMGLTSTEVVRQDVVVAVSVCGPIDIAGRGDLLIDDDVHLSTLSAHRLSIRTDRIRHRRSAIQEHLDCGTGR